MKHGVCRLPQLLMMFAALLSCFIRTGSASAQILAQSNFDANAEGWTVLGISTTCSPPTSGTVLANFGWQSSGGVQGGFLRHSENGNTGSSFFRAPASFLGDKSAAYGGSLTFYRRVASTDPDFFFATDDVYIKSPDMTLVADASSASRDSWGVNRLHILPNFWRVNTCTGPFATESQIRQVLGAVTDILIRAEDVTGPETQDLDSVVLTGTPIRQPCPATWTIKDNASPLGRWRHSIAVDTDRNVLVLYGGDTGEVDTWEFGLNSLTWVKRETSTNPGRKGGHAMVYDQSRHRTVLTGGGYIVASSEVWEYDGVTGTWTLATPLPQARSGHSMTYDSARATAVIYGGLGAGVTGSVDVLERSSASDAWTSRAASTNPGAQIGYAMTYDSARGKTVLVGEGTTAISLWEWDGLLGTWEVRSFSGTVPAARGNPTFVYDPSRAKCVLMGGDGGNSTWDYDGAAGTWTQRANISGGGRDEHAAVYDPLRHRILLSGGLLGDASPQRDLKAFDGATNSWTNVWSATSPAPRDLFGIAYDEAGRRTVLYGGALVTRAGIVQQVGGGVFTWDGEHWTVPNVTGTPGSRWFFPLVYDSTRRKMMVYGGATGRGPGTATSRLWELDLATMAWSDRTNQTPGQRFDHAAAYDSVRRVMVVQGGTNDLGARLGDTWRYDPSANTWTPFTGEVNPGARTAAAMAFDAHRGVIVLFGGYADPGQTENSTWEWDGSNWRNATPALGNPPGRLRPLLTYDPVRQRVVLSGGVSSTTVNAQPYNDLWEFDGASWREVPQVRPPEPIARTYSGWAYDTARSRIVHFGGASIVNGNYRSAQAWDLEMPSPTCNCLADFDDGSGLGIPDGGVTIEDLLYYLGIFNQGVSPADVDDGSGTGTADGGVTIDDLLYYLQRFELGC